MPQVLQTLKIDCSQVDLDNYEEYEEILQDNWYMSTDGMTKSQIVTIAKFLEYNLGNEHQVRTTLEIIG